MVYWYSDITICFDYLAITNKLCSNRFCTKMFSDDMSWL